ncbi:MAG: DUF1963 domain-containing protein [Neisseriaceae bacterium]|nr:DUF1963 domain-containing protein [Neisseriaceae bacterium]
METQADFELTAEEMAELKALLELKAGTMSWYNGVSFNLRRKLVAITDPVEFKKCLSELKSLNLVDENLINNSLPDSIRYLSNLEWLSIHGKLLKKLPESIVELKQLDTLHIFGSFHRIQENDFRFERVSSELSELPKNIGQLKNLEELNLNNCHSIKELPESMTQLNNLKRLFLSDCKNLITLPENIGQLNNLQKLDIRNTNIFRLPESIGQLHNLREFYLSDCKNLTELPESIAGLKNLTLFHIRDCEKISTIPDSIQKMPCFFDMEKVRKEKERRMAELELKKSKIKQLTDEQTKQILKELEKQTAQTAIKIKIKEANKLPLTASKFGGVPYWDIKTPYPVDSQGNKMILLAQINFAEMPPLPDFPQQGLLQFFMTRNVYEMPFYDNPTQQKDWRVVYHTNIDENIQEKAVLSLNIPYTPQIFDEEDDGGFPVDTQYQLIFKKTQIRIGMECVGFYKSLKNAAKEVGIKLNQKDLVDLVFDDKYYEQIKQHNVEHLIGGYPDFTQTDPREMRRYKKHSVLLLQIESDEGIMWGDCGVGNFFIKPDDLKKQDFSKVLFNWDCC